MGRAAAIEMARQGARVVVADINDDNGQATVDQVSETGGDALYIRCDVRDRAQIRQLMDGAAERFGGIDVLHNNAGVHDTDFTTETTVDKLPEDVWDTVYEINVRGVWLCTKYAPPYLRESEAGAIVNAASVASFVGYPMGPCYVSTKGAVMQLTKATAIDLAPYGMRCNCYCPGTIHTPMVAKYYERAEDPEAIKHVLTGSHLIPRIGRPEEVAKLVCFLASDDASFINGAVYLIDGGALAWRGTNA
jgi:NAD(P)-dependent dehydrogenase (short-subunit alcohol dehydrogenase family)